MWGMLSYENTQGRVPPPTPHPQKGLNREVVLGEGFIHIEIMREKFQTEKKKGCTRGVPSGP